MARLLKLIIVLLFFKLCSGAGNRYRTTLKKLAECTTPDLPYANYSPFEVQFESYNSSHGTNLLRGNLTIKEDVKQGDRKFSFKCGIETSEGLKWRFVTKDLGCKNVIIRAVFGTFGIPFNKCSIKKGIYYLKNIDVAAADRAFQIPARTFGNWLCVFAIYDTKNTLGCWDAFIEVTPIKASKT